MGFLGDLGSGLGRLADAMSENARKSRDERVLKEATLDRLSIAEIRLMCRLAGVGEPDGRRYDPRTGRSKMVRLAKGDYAAHAAKALSLDAIKEFAARHARIQDLLVEEKRLEAERTRWRAHADKVRAFADHRGHLPEVADLRVVVDAVRRFRPARAYREELFYEVELAGFLKHRFPEAAIEVQQGHSRPDIVVGNVAIEVKGPTSGRDLATIFDKCLRYTAKWDHLVVVLFAVDVEGGRYAEWERSLKKHFPDVTVVKK